MAPLVPERTPVYAPRSVRGLASAGSARLRSARPKDRRAYYVWRVVRFRGGVDMTCRSYRASRYTATRTARSLSARRCDGAQISRFRPARGPALGTRAPPAVSEGGQFPLSPLSPYPRNYSDSNYHNPVQMTQGSSLAGFRPWTPMPYQWAPSRKKTALRKGWRRQGCGRPGGTRADRADRKGTLAVFGTLVEPKGAKREG
jgi:hypothetical protein